MRSGLLSLGDASRTFPHMLILLARTQPWYFLALILLECLQGLVPLLTAWIMKGLFDLLAHNLQKTQHTPNMMPTLFFLLAAQACILLLSQTLSPVNTYFQTQLNYKLAIVIKTKIYQKIAGFVGLAYIENSTFHDTIQITANNAQSGPSQSLRTLTTFLQGIETLSSFLGVLLSLQPFLALLLGVSVIPQLYAQHRFGQQRFQIVFSQSMKERMVAYYGQVLTWTNFAKEIRLFNLGDYFLRKFIHTSEEIYEAKSAQQRHELRWQPLLIVLANLISSGTFIFVVLQAFSGHLSLGDMALYTSAVASVEMALANIILEGDEMLLEGLLERPLTQD